MKTPSCSLLLLLFSFATPVFASPEAELKRCLGIKNETARLNCYDAVSSSYGNQPTDATAEEHADLSVPAAPKGKWEVREEKDPITDAAIFTAVVQSEGGGNSFQQPAFAVRCQKDKTEVFIVWQDYLADNKSVTIRFDDEPPSTSVWSQSTDQRGTFATYEMIHSILARAIKAETFTARITPYRSGPITAVFDVQGMSNAFASQLELCGIKLE